MIDARAVTASGSQSPQGYEIEIDGGDGDDEEAAGQASKDALDATGNNPFGRSDAAPAPGPSRAARTERGYRKTREAIEKGMAEANAAGLA